MAARSSVHNALIYRKSSLKRNAHRPQPQRHHHFPAHLYPLALLAHPAIIKAMPIFDAETFEFISRNAEQTRRLGARLGAHLQAGDVIALVGDLGSGKTVFAQGIGAGWGVTDPLLSPTFVLIRRHSRPGNRVYLYHIDLYRLETPAALATLGLEDLLGQDQAICVVEWADRAPALFPREHLWITLHHLDEQRRSLVFRASGTRHRALLDTFRKEVLGR